jgi:hypothetical protein
MAIAGLDRALTCWVFQSSSSLIVITCIVRPGGLLVLPGRILDEDFNWQDMFCTPFQPQDGMCIYLIRLVQEYQKDQLKIPAIRLFKDLVEMDKQYINTYVLVKLDVYREQLFIYVEPVRWTLFTRPRIDIFKVGF